jgi:hypothetical protein
MGLSGDRLRAKTARESEFDWKERSFVADSTKEGIPSARSHANSGAWSDGEI